MTGSQIYKKLAACPEFAAQFPMLSNYGTPVKPMTRQLIGREKQLRQLKAGLLRPELCNVLLLGEAGSGKALADTTLIPVADGRGYVAISDIKVGDYVFDENGSPTKVLGVFSQGLKHAYTVTFEDGAKIVCNDNHLWNVCYYRRKRAKNGEFETKTLAEIIDYENKNSDDFVCFVPRNGAVQRDPKPYMVHPYVFGVILGDNIVKKSISLSLQCDDKDAVQKFAEYTGYSKYVELCDRSSRSHSCWNFVRTEDMDGTRFVQLRQFLEEHGINSDYVFNPTQKCIPDEFLLGSIEQRYELLRGLLDANGTVTSDSSIAYTTMSSRLAWCVQELVRSLGMRATIESSADGRYRTVIDAFYEEKLDLFYSSAKKERLTQRYNTFIKNEPFCKDVGISYICDMQTEVSMTCIYVDSPSHLFQAGKEHIVTHNTALVQGAMAADSSRCYLEIDVSKMIADLRDNNEMAVKIKSLFDESAKFVKESGTELVLFIDEFHLICMLSDAAVEALKPQLADSGTRGVRVIVATTFTEFRQYISANQPLVQRLQRIEILPPSNEAIVSILKSYAKTYGVADQIHGTYLYEQIIELSNRYIPANSQPRKSILLLDLMVGWYRAEKNIKMDINLLYDVLKYSEGIELNVSVDAVGIKKRLDSKVFSQYLATSAVASRLQITSADLNNKTKPMGSFLFTGSTGVGKALANDVKIPVYTEDGSVFWKRNGDLQIGDYVFNRNGKPVVVTGVFPQGLKTVYEVELTDGRKICCSGDHIWTYKCRYGNGAKFWKQATTIELWRKNSKKQYSEGRRAHNIKFVIPMNQPVQWDVKDYKLHPYVVGAGLGNGCFTKNTFTISSSDEECIAHIAELIGADSYYNEKSNYDWHFRLQSKGRCIRTDEVLVEVPELLDLHSNEKYIPDIYKHGSVEQRWELIKGLFDTDGTITKYDKRYNISYSSTSKQLVVDIQEVLYSLGVSSSINCHYRKNKTTEYDLHVKIGSQDKEKFFYISRKRERAKEAVLYDDKKVRIKKFGEVIGIREIKQCECKEEMTCIMVDDPEHLYQAGDFIVTHNTELTKQLAEILFADPKRLIRFDMTEYSQPESIERFRSEVTSKVWARPYSVLLFDEIEKACGDVTRILLQVLDDGRLIDQNNREVSFLNTYIVLTTNAASEIYETVGSYVNDDSMSEADQIKALGKYMKVIRRAIVEGTGGNKFPPELLGRVDAICPFMPLSEATQKKILEKRMDKLRKEVEDKHSLNLQYDKEKILRFILGDKLDTEASSGGARIVATKFEEGVVIEVARIINLIHSENSNIIDADNISGIYVTVEGDMAIDNKNLLEGDANIVAYPIDKTGKVLDIRR